MNHLYEEKSPYLLQHALNPVDWYPWGAEAFEKARREDKPVFLSIGYSTCHWCHVMAHESFEDTEVAGELNRGFVCIKVDREERPDIDAVYMSVCQALTGSGGWPLTIVMTPEQKPFWAGTYLPKKTAYGRTGLLELLKIIREQWETKRPDILSTGEQITALIQAADAKSRGQAEPDRELLRQAARHFADSYDERRSGFGMAPKFPAAHNLLFLLRYSVCEDDPQAGRMAQHTLRQMFRGGIFDHLGGGFSRYSTDEEWLIPHFEKMLYDNALLALAYLEAYRLTRQSFYAAVAEQTLDYVLRELADEGGGFYCGQDADSGGAEGKYYVFTGQELEEVLGRREGALVSNWFGVTQQGNFEGENVLNLLDNPDYEETPERIIPLIQKLYAYRLARTRLHKDDKILTSWNSLMIAALAEAGFLLEKPVYSAAAEKAYQFIQENLRDGNGRLMLRWCKGEAAHNGQLEDYAFFAGALLALYRCTGEIGYLEEAETTAELMTEQFWDPDEGGFFLYAKEGEQLISRPKEVYDGALPSGNSAAAFVLESLSALTGETKWRERSDRQFRFLAGEIHEYPSGSSAALLGLLHALYPAQELICASAEEEMPADLKALLQNEYRPNLTWMHKTPANQARLVRIAPFTAAYPVPEKGSVCYLCRNGACEAPSQELRPILEQLHRKERENP